MSGTCPRCGKAGLVIENAELPISGSVGDSREIQVVRCGFADCLAVVGAVTHDAAIVKKLNEISEKLDRLARALGR